MASVTEAVLTPHGFRLALLRLRDPFLFVVAPITFALATFAFSYPDLFPLGFDFRGPMWEPARAALDGMPVYPDAVRESILVGNPAIYPPLAILVALPLASLPVGVASALWFAALAACVVGALRLVGVRDWRCHVLALTSPVVVHGLYFGNFTVALLLPVALCWRYRDRALVAGAAVGAGIAAKLVVWPLVVWLLVTRRFAAAGWALAAATLLFVIPWALIGFDGLAEYPGLVREARDVFAVRSVSVPAALAALGLPTNAAVNVGLVPGLAVLCLSAFAVRGRAGELGAFALIVAACVLVAPIVWFSYLALLFVPIAIRWPTVAPAWFFGYVVWFVSALSPLPQGADACCRPAGVPEQAWLGMHAEPLVWDPLAVALVASGVAVAVALPRRRVSVEGGR